MHLPNELVLEILQSSDRTDLKSARLVCKNWYLCASRFLFDKIYIAPNEIDIQVFEAITQHPILGKCVRHLVYDASVFASDISKESYLVDFFQQMLLVKKMGEASPDNTDPQIVDLINHYIRSSTELVWHWQDPKIAKWKDHSFFHPGYQAYQEHSVYQRRALQSGSFLQTLVLGLSRLSCLESVSLQGGWTLPVVENLGEHHYGTPLARRWNHFHCFPQRWIWEPGTDRHFGIITTALARTKTHIRQIDEFAIDRGVFVENWYFEKDRPRVNRPGSGIVALSGIKRLHLNLVDYLNESVPGYDDNSERLPKLLGSMPSLQRLHISVKGIHDHGTVFSKDMTWNHLEDLTLDRLYSNTTDLLRLLLLQMPRLINLALGTVTLMDEDRWPSVVECLRQFRHFTTFQMNHGNLFYYFLQKPHDYGNVKVVDYVMNGGRNPFLLEEGPTSTSEAYMLQIDASLRDSLYEMKRSRTQTMI